MNILRIITIIFCGLLFQGVASPEIDSANNTYYIPLVTKAESIKLGTATFSCCHDNLLCKNIINNSFDIVVPEWEGNYAIVMESGTLDWTDIDYFVEYHTAIGKEIHYHTIFWHYFELQPPNPLVWLTAVMTRYPTIKNWIVVNEGYNPLGYPNLPYIESAYTQARIIRPDAILWYNGILDTSGEQNEVKRLIGLGFVDGVGIQFHLRLDTDLSVFTDFITWLNSNNIAWRISELDIAIPEYTQQYIELQANKYAEVLEYAILHRATSVTFWEWADRYSWIKNEFATPFTIELFPKPAWNVFVPNEY